MPKKSHSISRIWIYDLLFVLVLVVAAALRFVGINWDEDQHLHPDERFLTQVESRLEPVHSLREYFDTANSTLNPNNRDFGFFVYGTLPIFIVRYVAEVAHFAGYGQVHLIGRALSALADLGVITLVYLIGARLFDKRVGLLAATLSAFSVMQIQQSHFFTVDNFVNLFTYLALFFAIRVAIPGLTAKDRSARSFNPWDFVVFGIALGLALASKVSVVPLAAALPAAVAIWLGYEPTKQRSASLKRSLVWMSLSAILSLVVFRVFQPYAFLGLGLNPHWVETMRQLAGQVSGDADWPPSMQWARRPFWFGLRNIVRWGLGWPLAAVSWGGFLWAGWRFFKGEWRKPQAILWGWAAFYFIWQSMGFNPTMRYFLPVYPALAVFGAWGVLALWDADSARMKKARWQTWARPAALLLGTIAVLGGALWSLAFLQVYRQEVSRIQATQWIYQNLPGPITVEYGIESRETRQPLPVPYDFVIRPDTPFFTQFTPQADSQITQIDLKNVLAPVQLDLTTGSDGDVLLARLSQVVDLLAMQPNESTEIIFNLPSAALIDPAAQYHLIFTLPQGEGQFQLESAELRNSQNADQPAQLLVAEAQRLAMGDPFSLDFTLALGTVADRLVLRLRPESPLNLAPLTLRLKLGTVPDLSSILVDQQIRLTPTTDKGGSDLGARLPLRTSIPVTAGQELYLQISLESSGVISLLGSATANESSWDDGLPLRLDGYDGFGGIYQGDLNFEMYWDEDASKLARFQNVLDHTEYIFITSSRQWGSLPRLPERFPLVVAYYRALLGCPENRTIEWCYSRAQVGSFDGQLGFDLVQVFESGPRLGPWRINDQEAEEAFSVYDHPKVFIFQKNADYDSEQVAALLSSVDLTHVIHLTPKQAGGRVLPDLMLPADRWEQQRAGGTWVELFNTHSWINASPWVSAIVWYLALAALGLAVYPLVRWALPGLKDGGYPFARLAGLLLLSYLSWMGGSLGLSFSRGLLLLFALVLIALGALAARAQWPELKQEWKAKRKQLLRIELLFLAFFLLMLFIRLGNPDLWHPAKGGEKPMDFSYFNAVLKSTTFPPYDPWFAGGYINYYYYGFVLVGSLVKLLGIVPAVAYNLILPSLFSMLALGAYSVAWNLWLAWKARGGKGISISPEFVGLAAALAIVLVGNLGNLQMIFQGYTRLGSQGAYALESGLPTKIGWSLRGLFLSISGQPLPFSLGDWYWNPTRIIPALNESAPITEFPLFTFTYADLHAHMIVLPVTLLALGWALSAVLSRAWQGARSWLQLCWIFAFGAIIIGSLRPINTWDLPVYLALAALAAAYAIWRYLPRHKVGGKPIAPWLLALGSIGVLGALSLLAYTPFSLWYRQGYSSIEPWRGTHTPSGAYLVHWGIFLFFIVAWMVWETRQWMASTPLSSLRKLVPYRLWIYNGLLFLFGLFLLLWAIHVYIAWLVLPLLVWTGLLLLRPKQEEAKRLVLFLIGTGLFLTLLVEVIVLKGDIARMNTVFKFYMQAWVLLALGATFAFAWSLEALWAWSPNWRGVWQLGSAALLASSGLFLLLGVTAKMRDRMASEAPHTLDGMAYMQYSVYYDQDQALDLRQDYEAIRWLQENIEGSPVIVEAHTGEYRWGSRITIYTGLPSVLGWNWHQRQQREFVPGNDIWGRVAEIQDFYLGTDLGLAKGFLQRYQVKYIILGQLERAYFPGPGLDKFDAQDGVLWREVFRVGDTVIYEVQDNVLAQ